MFEKEGFEDSDFEDDEKKPLDAEGFGEEYEGEGELPMLGAELDGKTPKPPTPLHTNPTSRYEDQY